MDFFTGGWNREAVPATAQPPPWVLLLHGVVSIIAGILTFVWPGITALSLVLVIGWWAIVTGILEIATAIRMRREISNEWLLAISGALSIVFGVLVLINPGAGARSITWIIGWYAILFGAMLVALALRLRRLQTTDVWTSRPRTA